MRLSSIGLLLIGILSSLLLSSVALADGFFTIQRVELTATMEHIKVNASTENVAGTCVPEGASFCFKMSPSVHVTPCPVSGPCTNASIDPTYGLDLWLGRGQSYTFDGSMRIDIGTPWTPTCHYTCVHNEPIATKTYQTEPLPAVFPQLNAAVTSANADTVWVELGASDVDTQKCTEFCGYSVLETYFEVSPCALAAPLAYHLCQNGVTTGEISAPRRLALKPGVTYTMWASFERYGFSYSLSDHACTNQACLYAERTPDLVYTPVVTATTPITWGAVKAMYRSP